MGARTDINNRVSIWFPDGYDPTGVTADGAAVRCVSALPSSDGDLLSQKRKLCVMLCLWTATDGQVWISAAALYCNNNEWAI